MLLCVLTVSKTKFWQNTFKKTTFEFHKNWTLKNLQIFSEIHEDIW